MPEGNYDMSKGACIARASHAQEHERMSVQIRQLQQQIKLLFALVKSKGEHHA